MGNSFRVLEHRPRKPKSSEPRRPPRTTPEPARRAVSADAAAAVAEWVKAKGEASVATLAPALAVSGLQHRGCRYTEAPTSQDVVDLFVAAGKKKMSARTMRTALGPRGPVVRKARQAARMRRSREKLEREKQKAAQVRFG